MSVSGLEKRLANLRPYKPGQNRHTTKRERIAARLEELRAEYDPAGNAGAIDRHRLELAARHFIIAESARDPTVGVRSVRTAEYLLNKVRPAPARSPAADQAAQALALLLKPSDEVE